MSQYETKHFVFEPGNMSRYEIVLSPFRRDGDTSEPPSSFVVTWLNGNAPRSFLIPHRFDIIFESYISSKTDIGRADLAAILFSIMNNTRGVIQSIVGFDQYDNNGVYVSGDYKRPNKTLKGLEA